MSSPKQQVESIVRSLEKKGVPPDEKATVLATSYPEAVSDLAKEVMRRFPKGGTFLDGAFSYLPQERWPELVQVALDILENSDAKNDAAASVVGYASLQSPSALHPHLDRIFRIRPNMGSYYECYPWRESGDQHYGFLRHTIENSPSMENRGKAWTALWQTRHTKLIKYAISCADDISPSHWSSEAWVQAHLHLVGFHRENRSLRRTCSDTLFHLQFPERFFEPQSRPPWLARIHPTWKLSGPIQKVSFGGESQGQCSLCGGTLHRLFTLHLVPPELGIKRLKKLELATCLSCLGWEQQPLFYQHTKDGSPSNIAYDGPRVKPQFRVGPLREAEIGVALTPRRWFWQDWALSNGRENLNRVGGEPCWVQDAEYPNCPSCKKAMAFLFQLDSDLPTADGGEWLWGSGGIAYGFWCDKCRVSAFLSQCT